MPCPVTAEYKMKKRFLACFLLVLWLCCAALLSATAVSYATVQGGRLRLRAEPSYTSQILSSYPNGTQVTVLSMINGWCRVTTPDNLTGYMDQKYLNFGVVTPTVPVYTPTVSTVSVGTWYTVNQTGHITSSNGRDVRMRSEPVVTGTNVIGLYPVGRTVTVLKRNDSGWSYIRIDKKEGFMMSKFIRDSSVTPVTPTVPPGTGTAAYLYAANGRNVNVRRGPGMNYGILASYRVGTQLTVWTNEGEWSLVTVNGTVGYVKNTFISYTSPVYPVITAAPYYPVYPTAVPTAVPTAIPTAVPIGPGTAVGPVVSASLDNAYPWVGCIIRVLPTPSNVGYTVVWHRDDGQFLSMEQQYSVSPSDVGHVIYALVSGLPPYSGVVSQLATAPVTVK